MIKPNELRVGNWVLVNRLKDDERWETTIEEIELMHITASLIPRGGTWVKYEDLEPIPLTPEWLERCGFVKQSDDPLGDFEEMFEHELGERIDKEKGIYKWWLVDRYSGYIELKHVHQLQNIYFTLTGQELQIKPQ